MSNRNDFYQPLVDLGLSGKELESAKARVRAAKSHFIRTEHLNAEAAAAAALKGEIDRFKVRDQSVELPIPPQKSGLKVRGCANPQKGQSPLHWSFLIYDVNNLHENHGRGKVRRVRYDEIPTEITAMFPKSIEESIKLKRRMEREQAGMIERVKEQDAWLAQNKEHKNLAQLFISERLRARGENNRKSNHGSEATALRVIFDFFLNRDENHFLQDVRHWSRHFDDFFDYLRDRPVTRRNAKGVTLRKNTQKNYIAVLNQYVAFAWKKGKFGGQPPRCKNYKKGDFERRGIEALIEQEEEKAFVEHFKNAGQPEVGAFMKIGNHIAARPAELLGISILDVKPGAIPENSKSSTLRAMKASLETIASSNGLAVFGYVIIRGQVDNKSRKADGSVYYYPAKTAKTAEPKYYRYCPVVDESVWNTLVELVNKQKSLYQENKYGPQLERYLIFDKLSLPAIQEHFRLFREGQGKKWAEKMHTPHCCRHTGCTYWVALANNNLAAAQAILGHTDPAETRYYSHLAELIAEEMTKLQAELQGDAFFDQFKG